MAEPAPEPKIAALPVDTPATAPIAASVDAAPIDAIARSLALIEERLRATPAAPAKDEALDALKSVMQEMGTRMEAMAKRTERSSRQANMAIFLIVFVVIAGIVAALVLPMLLPR